jgi:hypothetical protein
MYYNYLSLSDLLLIDGFAQKYAEQDEQYIKEVLWKHGVDVTHPFEEEFVQHRNLRKEIVSCNRYIGKARSDKEWLRSGLATLEEHIAAAGDVDLRSDLKNMSREFNGYEELVKNKESE